MASIQQKYVPTLKFTYEDFLKQDIPNLMINIWSYSDHHGKYCMVYK